VIQVELIRQYIRNRLLPQLKARLTVLPETEHDAWSKLNDRAFCDELTENILDAMGRVKPSTMQPGDKRPRGRPTKAQLMAEEDEA
jgi:hypothetical protein